MIGNSGVAFAWRLGREQVIEDVITGLKLFPWVLGRTHKTTQNWVQSQYDLLMQMVQSHQSYGIDLANWICAKELELQGIKCKTQHTFDRHPDPFRIERARAASLEMQNIDFLVKEGYVSKEEVTSRVLSCVLT